MNDFNRWCEDAGPLGPALWLFDLLIKALADSDSPSSDSDPGLLPLVLAVCAVAGLVIGITVATHT